jgi:hypothetical protein
MIAFPTRLTCSIRYQMVILYNMNLRNRENENDQLKNSIDLCKNSDFADNDECHTDNNKQLS